MIILGINAFHADSSAAILVNGKLIAATEEERFTRVKHWSGLPIQSISFCLQQAGITLQHVNHIAIGRDPKAKLMHKAFYLLKNASFAWQALKHRWYNSRQISHIGKLLANEFGLTELHIQNKIHFVEHHRSHLASCFFVSPFKKAALLSVDGSGDFTTTMLGLGIDNQIASLQEQNFPVSLGTFYTAITQLLGFPNYGDEYKVMGMSSYGKPLYIDELRKIIKAAPNGLFTWDPKYFRPATQTVVTYGNHNRPHVPQLFSHYMEALLFAKRQKDEPLLQKHFDLAASVQLCTEELIYHILHHLHKLTGLDDLCIAGGVAQNSVAMGKIIAHTPFKRLYVPPAAHDAGISMGAAFYVYNQFLKYPRLGPLLAAYAGIQFSNMQIEVILHNNGLDYKKYSDNDVNNIVSDCIMKGGVVGWFKGKAEFGPRALGARSILADPRRHDAKELLNIKIKRRENFRPFAPAILKEFTQDYFECTVDVPFMEKVFKIVKDKQGLIPAVTHIDGTGRLQTVDKEHAPQFYALIYAFYAKTKIPILLNTSFNENEPIVNTPQEAIDCFLRTKMDMLVLENCIITRN